MSVTDLDGLEGLGPIGPLEQEREMPNRWS